MLNQGFPNTADVCSVLDTLKMARDLHPGQKNNLDALCRRYDIDNSKRTLHGALLDSEILLNVRRVDVDRFVWVGSDDLDSGR